MLAECRIRETLAKYGEVWLFGSYDYDLMVWPEIDIRVANPHFTPAIMWNVAKDLSSVVKPTIVFIANQMDHSFGWSPEDAVIMDYRFKHRDEHWKLDISFTKCDAGPDAFPLHPIVKARLTPSTHALIRCIKERLITSPRYLKSRWGFTDAEGNFSSYHIYTAVLRDGVTSPQEFVQYLWETRGIDVSAEFARELLAARGG